MVGENFKIYCVQITEKCICEQKIKFRHFYTCPQGKSPQVLIVTPQAKENYPFSPQERFFENLFPPAEMGKETMKQKHKKLVYSCIIVNLELRI